MIVADQRDGRDNRPRNALGRRVAGHLLPKADADQPALGGDMAHQVVGEIALGGAVAIGAGMADDDRHIDHLQHLARHLGRGMGEVDDDAFCDHRRHHLAPEIGQPAAHARLAMQ